MTEYYNTPGTASGLPKYYANWDANFWVVAPTPNSTFEITLAYIKQPDTITSSVKHRRDLRLKQISGFTFVCMSGRSIWILERSSRYVTIL